MGGVIFQIKERATTNRVLSRSKALFSVIFKEHFSRAPAALADSIIRLVPSQPLGNASRISRL